MKSRSFTWAKRHCSGSSSSGKWAKMFRSRIDRRYVHAALNKIKTVNEVEDFDILPLAQSKPGYWAWVID